MLLDSDSSADACDLLCYPVFEDVAVCSLSSFAVACAHRLRASHMDVVGSDVQLAAANSKYSGKLKLPHLDCSNQLLVLVDRDGQLARRASQYARAPGSHSRKPAS